jgi:hypothetical protein
MGEFVEGCRDAEVGEPGMGAEFVVAAAQVLDEGVTGDYRGGGAFTFEA